MDRLAARARHPNRRMRFLHGLGNHFPHRHLEVLAFMALKRLLDEHSADRLERFAPHVALVCARDSEAAQLRLGRGLAGAELDPPIAYQIQRRDPLGDARRMVVARWQQHDPVPEPNLFGALAGRGQENFRRGRVRILLQKVMLHFPHVVDAEPIGELDLVQGVLKKLQLQAGLPWARKLMFIKGAELHLLWPPKKIARYTLNSVRATRSVTSRLRRSMVCASSRSVFQIRRTIAAVVK